jgi:hypothetical protein
VRRSRAGAEKSSGVRVIYFNRLSNPLLAHFRLPIAPEHFARWLTLFAEAANEVMTAPQCNIGCAWSKPHLREHEAGYRVPVGGSGG